MSTLTDFLTGIANALREKTGETGTIPAASFAEKIAAIQTGTDTSDATISPSDVRSGKIGYGADGKVTGTVEDVAVVTPSISVDSNGLITATATQNSGFVSAGTKTATKQLTVLGATTYTPGTADQTISAGNYLSGAQMIRGDSNLVAGNIKSGVSIFGVTGTMEGTPTKIALDIVNPSSEEITLLTSSAYVTCEAGPVTRDAALLSVGEYFYLLYNADTQTLVEGAGCEQIKNIRAGYNSYDESQYLAVYQVTDEALTDNYTYVRIKDQ